MENQIPLFAATDSGPSDGLYAHERYWSRLGYSAIAGTDEAGRGPLAGPVVAAAVILPPDAEIPFLNDSKQLTARRRGQLYGEIRQQAVAVAWSRVEPQEIDRINIYQASREAMKQALRRLCHPCDLVLSDAMPMTDLGVRCIPIIHGDALSASIAAASIIAKVERDLIMEELDREFPEYGFARNKGYGTEAHLKALAVHGPCPAHRRSFAPVYSWRPADENR